MKYFKYFIREQEEYLAPKPKAEVRPVSRIFTLASNKRGTYPHENHPLAKIARFVQKTLPYSYYNADGFLKANSNNNVGANLRKFMANKIDFHLSTPERFEKFLNVVDNTLLVKERTGSWLPSKKYVSYMDVIYHLLHKVPFVGKEGYYSYGENEKQQKSLTNLTKEMSQNDIAEADTYRNKVKDLSSPESKEMMDILGNVMEHASDAMHRNEMRRHLGNFDEIEHFDLPENSISNIDEMVYKYHPVWMDEMARQEQQNTPDQ